MDKPGNIGLNAVMRRDTPPRRRGFSGSRGRAGRDKNDDAVSSVVALMLLLAVIATFVSLYATTYVPGLKEQSEISRINSVKEAFMEYSSDIEQIVGKKTPASYGHMMPLGAGDVLMSPEKSSGTLAVRDLGNFTEIYAGSDLIAACGMVSVTFEPSYTFWEEQGYIWQYGYINVTKKDKTTPLTAFTMEDVLADKKFSTFASSFIEFEDKGEINTLGENELSALTIDTVKIVPGSNNEFISGNSPTVLRIRADVQKADPVATQRLNFTFTNSSTETVASNFSASLADKTEAYLCGLNYVNVIGPPVRVSDDPRDTISLEFSSDVDVIVRTVTIFVSAS